MQEIDKIWDNRTPLKTKKKQKKSTTRAIASRAKNEHHFYFKNFQNYETFMLGQKQIQLEKKSNTGLFHFLYL